MKRFAAACFILVFGFFIWLAVSPDRVAEVGRSAVFETLARAGLPRANLHGTPINVRLEEKGFALGSPVLLRLFKTESRLEVWMERGNRFELAITIPICKWSGSLGPKLREGDGQSPEGFYIVGLRNLKPDSTYYRGINIGFPNPFDQNQNRTGSFLMIHGNCVSIGCFAMTDAGIDDIYNIVEAALRKGQHNLQIHIFPFEMSEANLSRHGSDPWIVFWNNLVEGDKIFRTTQKPLDIHACHDRYGFGPAENCARVVSW